MPPALPGSGPGPAPPPHSAGAPPGCGCRAGGAATTSPTPCRSRWGRGRVGSPASEPRPRLPPRAAAGRGLRAASSPGASQRPRGGSGGVLGGQKHGRAWAGAGAAAQRGGSRVMGTGPGAGPGGRPARMGAAGTHGEGSTGGRSLECPLPRCLPGQLTKLRPGLVWGFLISFHERGAGTSTAFCSPLCSQFLRGRSCLTPRRAQPPPDPLCTPQPCCGDPTGPHGTRLRG